MPGKTAQERFPNLFEDLHKLEDSQKDIDLVEGYLDSVLKRLRIPHYLPHEYIASGEKANKANEPSVHSEDFFKHLVEYTKRCVEEVNKDLMKQGESEIDIGLFIAGGVVRTLLANMYKHVHERKSQRSTKPIEEVEHLESHEFDKKAREAKETFLSSSEFQLKQTALAESEPLYSPFVLGVGSDLDIYYEVTSRNGLTILTPAQAAAGEQIQRKLIDYMNAVESKKGLSQERDVMKKSLLPIADVKEYQTQMERTLSQGGSLLDTLAFKISEAPEQERKLRHAPDLQAQRVIYDFLDGVYDYVAPPAGQTASQKQSIRGLRALLEIPFLNVKDKRVLERELRVIIEEIEAGQPLDNDAVLQFEKLLRNANLEGAGNRAYFDKESPIGLGLEIAERVYQKEKSRLQSTKQSSAPDTRLRFLLPEFIQKMPIATHEEKDKSCKGQYYQELKAQLTATDEFKAEHTDNGTLYHGTSVAAGMNILRGGFVMSTNKVGTAVYGPGAYFVGSLKEAASYEISGGVVLPIELSENVNSNILSIKIIKQFSPQLLQEAIDKGFKTDNTIDEEAIFNLLRDRGQYAIDVVFLPSGYVVVQNQNVLHLEPNLKTLLTWFESKMRDNQSQYHKGELTFKLYAQTYNTYIKVSNLLGEMGFKDFDKSLVQEIRSEIVNIIQDSEHPLLEAVNLELEDIVNLLLPLTNKVHYSKALKNAAEKGHHEIFNIILDAGADINYRDRFGNGVLTESIFQVLFENVEFLLKRGVKVNNKDVSDLLLIYRDRDSLMIDSAIFKPLLKYFDPGTRNLFLAGICGDSFCEVDLVKNILEDGGDVNAIFPGEPIYNPIKGAVITGREELLRILLQHNPSQSTLNNALLASCTNSESTKIIRILLGAGANPNFKKEDSEDTALERAVRHNLKSNVACMLEYDIDNEALTQTLTTAKNLASTKGSTRGTGKFKPKPIDSEIVNLLEKACVRQKVKSKFTPPTRH